MHKKFALVVLVLAGCGGPAAAVPASTGEVVMVGGDVSGSVCGARKYLEGYLVETAEGTSVVDKGGVWTHVMWPMDTVGRRVNGEIELADNKTGLVVAVTGRRYKIGGVDDPAGFFACAHDVTPE